MLEPLQSPWPIDLLDAVRNRLIGHGEPTSIHEAQERGDEASVLVFVNQYATAKSTDNVVVSPTWELIRMVKRDGEWIIARMDAP